MDKVSYIAASDIYCRRVTHLHFDLAECPSARLPVCSSARLLAVLPALQSEEPRFAISDCVNLGAAPTDCVGSYSVSRLSGQQHSAANIGRPTNGSGFRAVRTHRPARAGTHFRHASCSHRRGNPDRHLPPSTTRSRLPVLGDDGHLKVPLSSVVSIGAGVTVSVKDSEGEMVAMISTARQFEAKKMLQTAETNEKAAAQALTAN